MKRITPENVYVVMANQWITIGTNEAGMHGGGIARFAADNWGAKYAQGFGPMGDCFGIPTKDWNIITLPLEAIEFYVNRFLAWVENLPKDQEVLVTKIGCGLAGYSVPDIAPMFVRCIYMDNVYLPQDFLDYYDGIYKAHKNDADTDTIIAMGR